MFGSSSSEETRLRQDKQKDTRFWLPIMAVSLSEASEEESEASKVMTSVLGSFQAA